MYALIPRHKVDKWATPAPSTQHWQATPKRTMEAPTSGLSNLALVLIDVTQVLHHVERSTLRPGDVHVHTHMVLARHHFGGAARALLDSGMVQRVDDIVLV